MDRLIGVCLGSAAGGTIRYHLSDWTLRALGVGFPYGTLAINVLGSFLIGLVLAMDGLSTVLRVSLTVGFLGGFTTFSAFSFETLRC